MNAACLRVKAVPFGRFDGSASTRVRVMVNAAKKIDQLVVVSVRYEQ
jgi:hypothetical protein